MPKNAFLQMLLIASVALGGLTPGPAGLAMAQAPLGTFSIVARDPATGDFGVAVQSRFLAVGAVVPWARAEVGVIATQAKANTDFGPEGLRMLGYGWTAQQVIDSLLSTDTGRESRQIALVDKMGTVAAFTGSECRAFAGHRTGAGYAVQGNILAAGGVLDSMASTFENSTGDLAARLIAALTAGDEAGGDSRGKQSAALLVVRKGGGYGGLNDRFVDLRVDDHSDPAAELRRLYALWNSTFLIEGRMAAIEQFNADRQFAAAQEETRRLVDALNGLLQDHPDDPAVLDRVARVLSVSGISRERALELSLRASRLAPGELRFLDTLAECHFRVGNVDEAIRITSEIVAKDPGNAYYRGRLQSFLDAKAR